MGEANAQIFEVHQMVLDDLDYVESIANVIQSQKINAEFAVATGQVLAAGLPRCSRQWMMTI